MQNNSYIPIKHIGRVKCEFIDCNNLAEYQKNINNKIIFGCKNCFIKNELKDIDILLKSHINQSTLLNNKVKTKMTKKFSDVKDVIGSGGDFSLPKITAKLNKNFIISKVRFNESQFGKYAVMTIGKDEFITNSKVLIEMLDKGQEIINSEGLNVTLREIQSNKNEEFKYLTFE